jgi:hypothetical protein
MREQHVIHTPFITPNLSFFHIGPPSINIIMFQLLLIKLTFDVLFVQQHFIV